MLPLSDGDGTYQISVCRNVSDTKYAQVLSASVEARLDDAFAPFLRPNQFVNYSEGSEAVEKARELGRDATDNLGRGQAVYDWVVTNLSYDYDKAAAVKTGYLPDVDVTMEEKKGICFDYASLMSAMLRSQGVPVKLVVGYTSRGEYHAWINVWSESDGWIDGVIHFDGKEWELMDPTFASSGKQSKDTLEYISNPGNYKTVISQQLLPTVDGKRVPAFEIMHLNNAVRTLVRESRIHQIDSVIQTSAAEGMISMDESILRLHKAGRISKEIALQYAMNPDQLQKKLAGLPR